MENTDIEKYNYELQDVLREMESLNEQRQMFQNNLTKVKLSMSNGIVPNKLYKKLMEAKYEYSVSIQDNLKIYRVLKKRKKELNTIISNHETELKNNPDNLVEIKLKLIEVKNKYFEFYRDKTRISTMRKMASDFIIDLDSIIKSIENNG